LPCDELHNLYSQPNTDTIIKVMKWRMKLPGYPSRMTEIIMVGNHARKRQLGRFGCMWKDTMKIRLKQIRNENEEWIHLV
jgi:hypothetical protein